VEVTAFYGRASGKKAKYREPWYSGDSVNCRYRTGFYGGTPFANGFFADSAIFRPVKGHYFTLVDRLIGRFNLRNLKMGFGDEHDIVLKISGLGRMS